MKQLFIAVAVLIGITGYFPEPAFGLEAKAHLTSTGGGLGFAGPFR